jgi:hypothetical protein
MAEFMDVHTSMAGVTAEALAAAHQADLDIQDARVRGCPLSHANLVPGCG